MAKAKKSVKTVQDTKCCCGNKIDLVAWILVLIGGLNWGLYGLLKFNLVDFLARLIPMKMVSIAVLRIIYSLVGVAALYLIYVMVKKK
jgi:uncharacterized membrane protein YuzA (DUF378 family)